MLAASPVDGPTQAKDAIPSSSKDGPSRNSTRFVILQRRVAAVKYAVRCFLRLVMRVSDVLFFGFSGVVERLWFRGRKIGQLALYLSVAFSAPNKII